MENETSTSWELPQIGDLLGSKYRIERLIGQGGMGAVYQARHEILGEPVALKFLLPAMAAHPQASVRFLNEARASARIRSEHVAKVLDVDSAPNGGAYLVLEFLEGTDLSGLLTSRGSLGLDESADYVVQALEALAHAHACGIVHRDLKPANLFLARRPDGTAIIKVLDFGISKAGGAVGVTNTSAMLGSPCFMAPEQVRSSRNVDPRADIWSVGVILYNLLTGTLPFQGENFGEVLSAVLEHTPPPMRTLRPQLPEEIDGVVTRCLQRDREARFADVAELAEALSPFCTPEMRPLVATVRRVLSMAPPGGASASGSFSAPLALTPSMVSRPEPPAAVSASSARSLAPFEATAMPNPSLARRRQSLPGVAAVQARAGTGSALEDEAPDDGDAKTLRRAPAVVISGDDDTAPSPRAKTHDEVTPVTKRPRKAADDDDTECSDCSPVELDAQQLAEAAPATSQGRSGGATAAIAFVALLAVGAAAFAFWHLTAESASGPAAAVVETVPADAGAPALAVEPDAPVGAAVPPAARTVEPDDADPGAAIAKPVRKPKATRRTNRSSEELPTDLDEVLLDRR